MAISIVMFDFGNVVADWDPAPRIAEYARQTGLTPTEVLERLRRDDFPRRSDRGHYSLEEMDQHICIALDRRFSREELVRLESIAFRLRPDVLAIARFVARSLPVGILTNNSPLLGEALREYFPAVIDLFEPILFSHQFGHVKPEPELFDAVQRRLSVSQDEILFIDDTPSHVLAAESVGWQCLHYRTAKQLDRDLARFGLGADTG